MFDLADVTIVPLEGREIDVEGSLTVAGETVLIPEWMACPSTFGESCVAMHIGASDDPEQAAQDFAASCVRDGACSRSGAVAECTGAEGTLETTGEKVPIEVVWYEAACGLDLASTCAGLGASADYTDLGGC
jgi:hypothetical protein